MLQLLALSAMEPPAAFEADKVRDEKVKVLQAIPPPTPDEVRRDGRARAVRARARRGGEDVPGYLEEDGVAAGLAHRDLRGAAPGGRTTGAGPGVPFYLRTGKRLARKVTEIAVTLKPVPHLAFQSTGSLGVQPNQLVLTVQPNEGVSLSLGAKIPGTRMRIRPVNMEFLYGTVVHVAVARGLRAADPRRDARRRDAVHAQRRGRGAVADLRPDRQGVGGGHAEPLPQYERARRARPRPTSCSRRPSLAATS